MQSSLEPILFYRDREQRCSQPIFTGEAMRDPGESRRKKKIQCPSLLTQVLLSSHAALYQMLDSFF